MNSYQAPKEQLLLKPHMDQGPLTLPQYSLLIRHQSSGLDKQIHSDHGTQDSHVGIKRQAYMVWYRMCCNVKCLRKSQIWKTRIVPDNVENACGKTSHVFVNNACIICNIIHICMYAYTHKYFQIWKGILDRIFFYCFLISWKFIFLACTHNLFENI